MLDKTGYEMVREDTLDGILLFAEQGVPPGDFLRAVLCNDLKGACNHADRDNACALFDIVRFCYHEIPSGCWGDTERYEEWMQMKADFRKAQAPSGPVS